MSKCNIDPESTGWTAYIQWRYGPKGMSLPCKKHMTSELEEVIAGHKRIMQTPEGAYAIVNK